MDRPSSVIPELCRGYILGSCRKTYTSRDVILYALGIGVSSNPMDEDDLKYTYENAENFSVQPTYSAVIPPIEKIFDGLLSCPGMPSFNPMMLLHAEEKIVYHSTLPTEATVECTTKIVEVEDKGKGALIKLESEVHNILQDQRGNSIIKNPLICSVQMSLFIRGIGGYNKVQKKLNGELPSYAPSSKPDLTFKVITQPNQAILYRLSGDTNPLHIDPTLAKVGGFNRPILHGLCSFGIVAAALLKRIGNAGTFRSFGCRFASPVTPGDSLLVRIWITQPFEILFEAENVSTKKVCLSFGSAVLSKQINIEKKKLKSAL